MYTVTQQIFRITFLVSQKLKFIEKTEVESVDNPGLVLYLNSRNREYTDSI